MISEKSEPAPRRDRAEAELETARMNVRMACALRDINPSQVSQRAGMARNGLSQFLAGRTVLSYANMLKVCDVLDIPIGILHVPDSITLNRVRIYRALEQIGDHQLSQALQIVQGSDQ